MGHGPGTVVRGGPGDRSGWCAPCASTPTATEIHVYRTADEHFESMRNGRGLQPPDRSALVCGGSVDRVNAQLLVEELSRDRTDPTTVIEAAAALIALSLRESEGPVEQLARALDRMSQALAHCGPDSEPLSPSVAHRHQILARELATCVQSLQFHDRMTQQLALVRNLLAGLAIRTMPAIPSVNPECWEELMRSVRARFTSESHRALFDLLMGVSDGAPANGEARWQPAGEGSVELF